MIWLPSTSRFKDYVPSILSLIRGVLGIIAPFLLFNSDRNLHLLAGFLFILGVLTDYWDGVLARKLNAESDLGKILDPFMDKILILSAMVGFSKLGYYSKWWLVPIIFREVMATFFRAGWLREGKAVGAEKIGKVKFFFQSITSGAAYLYFLSFDFAALEGIRSGSFLAMQILLVFTVFLTIISGISFVKNNWVHCQTERFAQFCVSTWVGFLPIAPGTWGSLVGVLIVLMTCWNSYLLIATLLFFTFFGWFFTSRISLAHDKDPSYVVIDEVCGILVTFLFIQMSWQIAVIGFFLFRFFDIVKPFPVSRFERLPGYWGILCDDLAAGVYARIVLGLIAHFFL